MNMRQIAVAAAAVVMGLSVGGCKKTDDKPAISETETARRYNEQRFNDLQAGIAQISEKLDQQPQSVQLQPAGSGAQITSIGPAMIEPALPPISKADRIRSTSQPVPTASSRARTSSKGAKTVVVSGVSAKDVQRALANAGFNPGKADGKIGPNTTRAIKQFQAAEGLKADGVVGPRTWDHLRKHL